MGTPTDKYGAGMGKLTYSAIASLDGFVEDASGAFDWAAPDAEVHAFVNELERPVGTYLYGRRMYETMLFWETQGDGSDDHEVTADFARVWRAADKVVYSRTLESVSSERTSLVREFEPEAVAAMKAASGADLTIGGAELAGRALAAGVVDELQLLLVPVLVGSGKPALPAGVRCDLELLEHRAFGSGTAFLRYRVDPR
jgi:dihydrofolate reductase